MGRVNTLNFAGVVFLISFLLLWTPLGANGKAATRQSGNTISGYIFTADRRPLYDVNVELMDDLSRFISRTKTNASGRYYFTGLASGRYRVRALPSGSDYESHEEEIEIQNFARPTPGGGTVMTGFDNAQRDFYLRKRKTGEPTGRAESIFVQNIPPEAKDLYEKSRELLAGKNRDEGYRALKSAIEIFPDYYDALERLGTEYVKAQYYDAARILLGRAVEINPRGYPSWYGLGYSLHSLNLDDQALKAVEKSLELNPNSTESLLLNGVTLRKVKRFKDAEKQLLKAKSASKNPVPEIHWHLALLYAHNLLRYNDAADELELYLKAKPESPEAENLKKLIKQFREKAASKSQ